MHKSTITFGLLASSLVMLTIMPLLNNNNNIAMAQGYDQAMAIVIIANIQPKIRNMSVEQVHLKASLYVR